MSHFFQHNVIPIILISFLSLLFPPQLFADKWRFLNDDKEALQCRFDLIEQAQYEILLSCFIFKDDVVGKAILHLLVKAVKERGVKVRIMVDSHNYKISKKIRAYLASEGVSLRKFSVKRIGKLGWFRGMHEKLLIIDNQWIITGGRNVEDKYFGLSKKFNFKDLDVLVDGKEAGNTARVHFFDSWDNPKVSRRMKFSKRHVRKQNLVPPLLEEAYQYILHSFLNGNEPPINWFEDAFETKSPVRIIHDDMYELVDSKYVKSDIKNKNCSKELIELMRSANSNIIIQNPYFIPTPGWQRFFKEAQQRGITITVLVNSIKTNDIIVYQAAYLNRRRRLLAMGLDIWEYQGPEKLHLKSIIIDGKTSVVGSYNIHYPSVTLNTEVVAVVEDEEIASYHIELFQENLTRAVRINEKNRPEYPPGHSFQKTSCRRLTSVFLARISVALWLNMYL